LFPWARGGLGVERRGKYKLFTMGWGKKELRRDVDFITIVFGV
jgi:hypothetical protein